MALGLVIFNSSLGGLMPNVNIDDLANQAAFLKRKTRLTMPGAVWRVLKAQGISNGPNVENLASMILATLQKRSVARRMKRIRTSVHPDMLRALEERNGDPDD